MADSGSTHLGDGQDEQPGYQSKPVRRSSSYAGRTEEVRPFSVAILGLMFGGLALLAVATYWLSR